MSPYITAGIMLGLFFIGIYFLINRHSIEEEYKDLLDIIYRSFMYAAGIVLGACTVIYAITGDYSFGLSQENLRLPISIGGSMLIVESARSQLKLIRRKKTSPPKQE